MEEVYFFISNSLVIAILISIIFLILGFVAFVAKTQKVFGVSALILMLIAALAFTDFAYKKEKLLSSGHVLGETEIAKIADDHVKLKNGIQLPLDVAEGLPPTTLVRVVKWERLNITRLCFGEDFSNCKDANEHIMSAIVSLRAKDESYYKNKQDLPKTQIELKYDLTGCAGPYNQIDVYYMNDNNERITVGVQECGQPVLNCEVIGDAPKPDENGKIIISAGTQVQCQYGE